MAGGIGLIVNPRASYHRRHPRALATLERTLAGHGQLATSRSLDELDAIAHRFRAEGVRVLAISGGDGTGSVTLEHLVRAYGDAPLPPIAFIRGGTMNTVATGCGVPRARPEQLLRRLVDAHRSGRALPVREIETMRVEGHIGCLFGTGAVHGFLELYYAAADGQPTPLTAAAVLSRGVLSAMIGGPYIERMIPRVACEVEVDGRRWPTRDYLSVLAGTVKPMGLGFRPFHRAGDEPRRVHVVGMHMSSLELALALPRIHRARPLGEARCHEDLVEHFVLHTPGRVLPYMLDGELYQASEQLHVELGPTLRVLGY